MKQAPSRFGFLNTYLIWLAFLAGMATGMWSAVLVMLFPRFVLSIFGIS